MCPGAKLAIEKFFAVMLCLDKQIHYVIVQKAIVIVAHEICALNVFRFFSQNVFHI